MYIDKISWTYSNTKTSTFNIICSKIITFNAITYQVTKKRQHFIYMDGKRPVQYTIKIMSESVKDKQIHR